MAAEASVESRAESKARSRRVGAIDGRVVERRRRARRIEAETREGEEEEAATGQQRQLVRSSEWSCSHQQPSWPALAHPDMPPARVGAVTASSRRKAAGRAPSPSATARRLGVLCGGFGGREEGEKVRRWAEQTDAKEVARGTESKKRAARSALERTSLRSAPPPRSCTLARSQATLETSASC